MKVLFTHLNGRQQEMEEKDASLLSRLKRGTYQTRDMVAEPQVSTQQYATENLTITPVEPPQLQTDAGKVDSQEDNEPRVSPAARDLAEKNNIDIAAIAGTGKNGRVTLRDVEAMIPSTEA